MWVLTTQGFYSVVAHRDDPDKLIVRARRREALQALREQIPHLRIFGDASADYRWRAVVTRAEWVMACALLAEGVDYDTFKGAVTQRQGDGRAGLYGRVWALLRELQREADPVP